MIKESGCEAQQNCLFYVFVTVFSLDREHPTIGFEFCMSNLPIKMLLLSYLAIVRERKSKDCAFNKNCSVFDIAFETCKVS